MKLLFRVCVVDVGLLFVLLVVRCSLVSICLFSCVLIFSWLCNVRCWWLVLVLDRLGD